MANVYTGGTFDLLHEGHLELLEACRRMAGDGKVIVGLNGDEFVEKYKGERPFQTYRERKLMLEACRYVDLVEMNIYSERSDKTIKHIQGQRHMNIDIVAIGSDWAPPRDYYGQMNFTKEFLDVQNIVLVYVDRRTGQSSGAIKERFRNVR